MQTVALFSDVTLKREYSFETAIVSDIDLFANSGFALYVSLTYDINGELTTDLLEYNTRMNNLRSVELEGYTFEGWYYDDVFTKPVEKTDKLSGNTTVYANMVKVLIDEEGETVIDHIFGFIGSYWYLMLIAMAVVGGGIFLLKFIMLKRRW